jgi:hypothetical protein
MLDCHGSAATVSESGFRWPHSQQLYGNRLYRNTSDDEYKQADSTFYTKMQICPKYLAEVQVQVQVHSNVGFGSADMAKIIRNGRLQLISLSISEKGYIKADLVEAQLKDAYVTISHIWSDGLCNIGGEYFTPPAKLSDYEGFFDIFRRVDNRKGVIGPAVWARKARPFRSTSYEDNSFSRLIASTCNAIVGYGMRILKQLSTSLQAPR